VHEVGRQGGRRLQHHTEKWRSEVHISKQIVTRCNIIVVNSRIVSRTQYVAPRNGRVLRVRAGTFR
jgi:hypothetical protein